MVPRALCALLCAVSALAMNMPSAEDMQKIDKLGALVSQSVLQLDEDNYRVIFNGSDWAVLFCTPKVLKCQLMNVPWVKIAESANPPKALMAKAMLNNTLSLFRLMGIRDAPTLLYISSGYIYNYTGATDWKSLENVLYNHTYLQYDRVPVQRSLFRRFSIAVDKVVKMQPAAMWTAEIVAVLLIVAIVEKVKGKKKEEAQVADKSKPKRD